MPLSARLPKFWLLFLIVGPLYLTWTFNHSLWNPDETRDAGIAREMYEQKHFAVPTLNGEPFLEKPPLYYWSCALIYRLSHVSAGTTRLPAALYGILGVLFTFLIGRELFGERTGFWAALMVATSAQYFRMSHFAMMDIALAACVTGALYYYLRGSKIGFALFTVLAFYAKGFLGVLLPGLVVTLDLLWKKQPKELLKTIGVGFCFFVLLAGPWFWALWREANGPAFLKTFIIDNHVRRYVANGTDHTEHGIGFYLISFPGDFLPWTLFLIGFLVSFFRRRAVLLESGAIKFTLLWFVSLFLFFTISSSKRSIYLLPLVPAAALLSAAWLEEQGPLLKKTAAALFGIMAAALLISNFALAKRLDKDKTFVPVCDAARANMGGQTLVGFDMSEMERGVFSFYLGGPFRNVRSLQELQGLVDAPQGFVLIANRNKLKDIGPVLEGKTQVVFVYRPQKKSRSYLIYKKMEDAKHG
jgi:4-amino-4-deoxy-L-arabinose transferase-like glycosyltransferase